MGNQDDTPDLAGLTAWAQHAAEELGLEPLKADGVDAVLAAAWHVSTGSVRSARPVATHLAGLWGSPARAPDVATARPMVGRLLNSPNRMLTTDNAQHPVQRLPD